MDNQDNRLTGDGIEPGDVPPPVLIWATVVHPENYDGLDIKMAPVLFGNSNIEIYIAIDELSNKLTTIYSDEFIQEAIDDSEHHLSFGVLVMSGMRSDAT